MHFKNLNPEQILKQNRQNTFSLLLNILYTPGFSSKTESLSIESETILLVFKLKMDTDIDTKEKME